MSIESRLSTKTNNNTASATENISLGRRLLHHAKIGGLAAILVLAGALGKDWLSPGEEPVSGYGMQVYQQSGGELGQVTYLIEAEVTGQPAAGTIEQRHIAIGRLTCQGQPDALLVLDSSIASSDQAQAANDQLDALCAPTGALRIDAAQKIGQALAEAHITVG